VGRRNSSLPAVGDTGRMGFREPGTPPDGRPVIVRSQFWNDTREQFTYQIAAESNPRKRGELPSNYVERLAILAGVKLAGAPAKRMPESVVRRDPYAADPDDPPAVLAELTEARDVELKRQRDLILADEPAEKA
jgi:hypothetical protein